MFSKWDTPQKDKKDARIEFLEKQSRWNLFEMELLASIGELQHNASLARDPEKILSLSLGHLKRLMEFQVRAFFLVNEDDADFVLTQLEPQDQKETIQKEIDEQIENGTFAWALNQNRPVVVKSNLFGKTMILHVLATKSRVRGMFVGILTRLEKHVDENLLYALSIILQNTANSLEGEALYARIFEHNKSLEETIHKRTKALEDRANELKEEITFRQLAEESLMIAKEEAETAARVKTEFLTNITHEIRTPLNAILGYTEILRIEANKNDQTELITDLKAIEKAGNHLLYLINDILDLSKIQAGKMEMHFEKFKVLELVEDVMVTIRPLAKKKDLHLEVTYQMFVPSMYSDLFRIRQILLNLLSNACKFTEKGTVNLKIAAKKVDDTDWVDLIVSDTGIGIPPDTLPDLFEEFSQAERSTTRKYGGTGLGLAISLRLCRMLGGDITVTSEVGKGSVFTVSLPLDFSKEVQLREPETAEPLPIPTSVVEPLPPIEESVPLDRETEPSTDEISALPILVVEDDVSNRGALCRILKKDGWKILEARDGNAALKTLETEAPGLILLDIVLPEMNGFEFITRLRKMNQWQSIPVIVITAKELSRKEKSHLHDEVEHIFHKGDFTRKELIDRIRKISGQTPADDETHIGPLDLGTDD